MPLKTLYDGSSTGVLFLERRQFYVEPSTYTELYPGITPFLTNMVASGNVKTGLTDPLFKMFEHADTWEKQQFTIGGGYTVPNDDTGVSLASISAPVGLPALPTGADGATSPWVGLMFECWTSDKLTKRGIFFISAVNGSAAVQAKLLGTTAFTTVSGDIAVCIGPVSGEGHVAREAWHDDLKLVWNSCGEHRTPVEISGILLKASLRGANNELARLRAQKFREHKIHCDRMILRSGSVIGTNSSYTAASGPAAETMRTYTDTAGRSGVVRTTMGLIPALETYGDSTSTSDYQNIFDLTGGCDFNQWIDTTEKLWQYIPDSGIKDFYCGPRALSHWSKINANGALRAGFQIQLSDMRQDKLGIFFKYMETPFGIARLIYTPGLKREYAGVMLCTTPENLFLAKYEADAYHTNIKQENRPTLVKDEYSSFLGLGIKQLPSHALIKLPVL